MKKKSACILLVFAAVIVLTYMTGESYYRGISEKAGLDEQEEKIYKYQYDMIVTAPIPSSGRQYMTVRRKKQLRIMYCLRSWGRTEKHPMINLII